MPRASLGNLTSLELDRSAPRADDLSCRARFYADTRAALERIALEDIKPRARRRAEREAIFCMLEKHGLLDRTTEGGGSTRSSKRK